MTTPDPTQMLYHLSQTIKAQTEALSSVQTDVHKIQIDIEVMKQTGVMPNNPADIKKERLKDGAVGGGIVGVITTVMMLIVEYIKTRG